MGDQMRSSDAEAVEGPGADIPQREQAGSGNGETGRHGRAHLSADERAAIEARDNEWVDVGLPGSRDPTPVHIVRHEGATHLTQPCTADAVRDRRALLDALIAAEEVGRAPRQRAVAMTTPTPLREAPATALRSLLTKALRPVDPDEGWTHWTTEDQADYLAATILASGLVVLSPDDAAERAEHEAVGRAVARLPDWTVIRRLPSGWAVTETAASAHPAQGKTLPEAIVAALGPEGERTEAGR